MSEYHFIRLDETRLHDLACLMYCVYGDKPDIGALKSKYNTEEFGVSYIGYLAYAEGELEPAAYYGVFPIKVSLNGSFLLAAQSGDTMTHPKHRGKGLFIELARRTYDLAKDSGINFVFGFPNKNSYPGFIKKLEWRHPYDMAGINIITPTIPISLVTRKNHVLMHWHGRLFYKLLMLCFHAVTQYEKKLSSVTETGQNGVLRDDIFIRYKQKDCAIVRTGSAYFILKYDGDISIGDIVDFGDGSDARAGISKIRMLGAILGIVRIKTFCSPNTRLESMMGTFGWKKASLPYGYVKFNEIPNLDTLQFTYLDYDTF